MNILFPKLKVRFVGFLLHSQLGAAGISRGAGTSNPDHQGTISIFMEMEIICTEYEHKILMETRQRQVFSTERCENSPCSPTQLCPALWLLRQQQPSPMSHLVVKKTHTKKRDFWPLQGFCRLPFRAARGRALQAPVLLELAARCGFMSCPKSTWLEISVARRPSGKTPTELLCFGGRRQQ